MSGLRPSSQNPCPARKSVRRFKVPGTTVALLTQTSKMPGPSWSLPAHRACPRAAGSICAVCYAERGCYRFRTTVNAQTARFVWTRDAMKTPQGRAEWVRVMTDAIRGESYFRVHDSGDVFSAAYAEWSKNSSNTMPGAIADAVPK